MGPHAKSTHIIGRKLRLAPTRAGVAGRRAGAWRQRGAEERGQAVVEFALVAGLLILLVLGIAQFGLAFNTLNDETHLANEAARYAAVNYDPAPGGQSLLSWIKSQADTGLLASGGQICVSFPNGTSNVGDPVQVQVSTNFNWQPLHGISQLLKGTLPASTPISGTAVMRLEATPTVYGAGCV